MTESTVAPETFQSVATGMYEGRSFPAGRRVNDYADGIRENGFVHASLMRTGALVGIRKGDTHIIADIREGSEVIGRGSPKLKTRHNRYVKAAFRECEYSGDYDDVDAIQSAFEDGERLGVGYIHGNRVTPLPEVLSDVFKWCSEDDDQ